MNRRRFLHLSGTVLAMGCAGCAAIDSNERERVVLTHVELGNGADESQMFDVLVYHNDEIIHWASHEVGAGNGEVVTIDGPDEPGHVEVAVRIGEEWKSQVFDNNQFDSERVIATVVYRPHQDLFRISWVPADRQRQEDE